MGKRAGWTLALMLPVLLTVAPAQELRAGGRDDARAATERGLRALAKGDPRTARVEMMNAIAADPDWAAPHVAQARVLLALGDGAGAQAEVERAQAAGAKDSEVKLLKAHALLLQGSPQGTIALGVLDGAVGLQQAYAARLLGQAHQMLGETGEAQAAFDLMLRAAPRDFESWTALARFRLATGDQAGAFDAAARGVALAPRRVEPLALQAVLMRDQYGLTAALPWFERALKADPNHVPALEDYAATLLDAGLAGKALSVTRRIIGLEPRNPRAFFLQAVLASRAGDMDLARALAARVGDRMDGVPAMLLLRGVLQIDAGNAALAVAPLEALLKMQPDNRTARTLLARAYGEAGRQDDAMTAIAPLADRPDAGSYAWLLAARTGEAEGRVQGVSVYLAQAAAPAPGAVPPLPAGENLGRLESQPQVGGTAIATIRALIAAGQADAAVARASALRAANPGAPAASVVLGDALLAAGRPDQAAAAYEKAANLRFSEDVALRLMAAWRHAGRPERASRVLSLYAEQYPASLAAQRLSAAQLMEEGDWPGAIAIMEAIDARIGHRDALLLADLAAAWLERGDAARAVVYARHAYRLQPASAATADIYGLALSKAGQGAAGVELLQKALALAPGNPLVHEHLRLAQAAAKGGRG